MKVAISISIAGVLMVAVFGGTTVSHASNLQCFATL
jgi:hypothetical protein